MKKLIIVLSALSFSCVADDITQEKEYSVGLGVGFAYSGIGGNFSFVSKTDIKYISAGCVEISTISGSIEDTTCGFGVGWIMTDLFDFNSNKHGIGIYATLVGNERYGVPEGNGYTFHDNDIYGAGVSYTYFLNGIDQSGFNFGISAHATNADYEDSFGGFLQAGYQF